MTSWCLIDATLDLVTIASHCLALLREHGPLTPAELGAACREAGVTASRNPEQAVISALSWNQDGRAFRAGGRFRAVTDLLDGRWLTFAALDDPEDLCADADLACLVRVVQREGLPLAGGGAVKARRYSYGTWTGPDGWLPAGETLGLRLLGGTAHVSAVVLDAAAEQRGEQLAALLKQGSRFGSGGYGRRHEAAGPGLLTLLTEDDDLLREPVPPLSLLLPAPPQEAWQNSWDTAPPFWATVQVHLAPELYGHFEVVARSMGKPLGHWLAEQLEWFAECPTIQRLGPYVPDHVIHEARERYAGDGRAGRDGDGLDDRDDPWLASPSVLPFVRPRGGDLGPS
jgi:hypothetical protein